VYLRRTLVPSLLQVSEENKRRDSQNLFEIANVYLKRKTGLPDERLHIAGLLKGQSATFTKGKGVVEQLFKVLGITKFGFEKKDDGIDGAIISTKGSIVGSIEVGEEITFELDLAQLLIIATAKKTYKEPAKFPPVIEDVRVEIPAHYGFLKIVKAIKEVDNLIHDVSLFDVYGTKKTFRITYLNRLANLTNEEITPIRERIYTVLMTKFKAKIG
jgi:phenylalanyl-tRNA synthetase beta subunit